MDGVDKDGCTDKWADKQTERGKVRYGDISIQKQIDLGTERKGE